MQTETIEQLVADLPSTHRALVQRVGQARVVAEAARLASRGTDPDHAVAASLVTLVFFVCHDAAVRRFLAQTWASQGSHHDDVLQDVVVRMTLEPARFLDMEVAGTLRAYAKRMAHGRVRDCWRRASARHEVPRAEPPDARDDTPGPLAQVLCREALEGVARKLETAGEFERLVLQQALSREWVAGPVLTDRHVADALGCVRTNVVHRRRRLMRRLAA